MSKSSRTSMAFGLMLILAGGWFLAAQFIPQLGDWFYGIFDWPVWIIGVGVFLLLFGLISGEPGMAVPAFIVGGIGSLLFWQNATGNWESWSYAWTFIPGFVGVGILVSALLGEGGREGIRSGLWLVFISMVMFAIFGSFLGGGALGNYWPILLILFGVWILIQPLFRRRVS